MIVICIALGISIVRRSKRHILELETQLSFKETDESILKRAMAVQKVMQDKTLKERVPVRELFMLPLNFELVRPPEFITDSTFALLPAGTLILPREKVVLDVEIGSGEFGSVWSGKIVTNDGAVTTVAKKTSFYDKIYANKKSSVMGKEGDTEGLTTAVKMLKNTATNAHQQMFNKEMFFMAQLNHPSIVSLLGLVVSDPYLLCLEFISLGSLDRYLQSELVCNGLCAQDIIGFSIEVCSGLCYLTEIGIVHRDIAARNILITTELKCKIADFGIAIIMAKGSKKITLPVSEKDQLPIRWTDPEALETGVWSSLTDMYVY